MVCYWYIKVPRRGCMEHGLEYTVEPLWEGQGCLTKVAKYGPFPCTILYKSYFFHPSWQVTYFERPPSWVAFIEGFHCFTFHVKKYIEDLAACSGPPLARDGLLGAPAFVKIAYCGEAGSNCDDMLFKTFQSVEHLHCIASDNSATQH